MFVGDDDFDGDEGEVGFSFAQLERLEAEKSIKSLMDIDSRLYSEVDPVVVATTEQPAELDDYRRYQSVGYDANYDCVEDKEIIQWRRSFPYLQVSGMGMAASTSNPVFSELSFAGMPPSVNMNTYREEGTFVFDDNLVVVGKAVVLHSRPEICEDGELMHSEGVVEEILAIDNSSIEVNNSTDDDELDLNEANLCTSPTTTQRDEVVSTLFSMIWPDIVQGMRPLIERVVELAQDSNMPVDKFDQINRDEVSVRLVGSKRPASFEEDHGDYRFNEGDEW